MIENDFRDAAWQSCTRRIVTMIEEYSASWVPGGISKTTAEAIIGKIRAMPVPQPERMPR